MHADDLRTLSYAANFLRSAGKPATSIAVTLHACDRAAARALERVCELAADQAALEVEIEFAEERTTVWLSHA